MRVPFSRLMRRAGAALVLLGLASVPAAAQQCGSDASGFPAWLSAFRQAAAAQGISPTALRALDGVTYDTTVIRLDRNQKHFSVSFEQFVSQRVTAGRIARAKKELANRAALFQRIEQRFGVPGPVLVAIWAMETDFGSNQGKMPIFRSLATLAYDCRRSAFFTGQLFDALRIIQRGDLSIGEARGAWAGEIGQTQFMPTSYVRYAVDFDGNGHADLIRSVPDVLASTANYLKGYGWSGRDWNANGAALAGWNKSSNYQKAIALFASKVAQ